MAQPAAENPFVAFYERYLYDWVALVREVMGGDPDEKQQEVLVAVQNGERRISVRSGHGVGKTTVLAWCIICHILTRYPQKTLATAPTSTQLFDALAAETKAWVAKLPEVLRSQLNVKSDRIELVPSPDESFVSFNTSRAETPEALAGKHSKHMLLIADEASGVPEAIFEAAIGSMSGDEATTVLAGNPVRGQGTFWATHMKPEVAAHWRRIHISCVGHPRIAQDFIDDVARRYGRESNAFRVRVLGEFPTTDDDTVIPRELLEAARTRDIVPSPTAPVYWGYDVARFGDDESALAKRKGPVLREKVQTRKGLDLMQSVGWLKAEYDATPPAERPVAIFVDEIGLGAGVVDRGREVGLPVRGINVSEASALNSDKYRNLRAELWFRGKEWFVARTCSLADDEYLIDELAMPRFTFTSNGKLQVESKSDMKKRGVASPNRADAFLLTLAEDATIAAGKATHRDWAKPLKRNIRGIT